MDLDIADYKRESTILNNYGLNTRKQNEQCNQGNKEALDEQGNKRKTKVSMCWHCTSGLGQHWVIEMDSSSDGLRPEQFPLSSSYSRISTHLSRTNKLTISVA